MADVDVFSTPPLQMLELESELQGLTEMLSCLTTMEVEGERGSSALRLLQAVRAAVGSSSTVDDQLNDLQAMIESAAEGTFLMDGADQVRGCGAFVCPRTPFSSLPLPSLGM